MSLVYYNEIDPFAAEWLRQLIREGCIAEGVVDERDVRDIDPRELSGYPQCHFFAGIGGWSYALRLAGWPDDQPCWTGSCPCQPFSAAGKGEGFSDPRHLWPQWFRLVRECRPVVVFGEQVDKALAWLDLVSGDLEGEGYAVGSAIVGAHSVGAPHRRQRLYWVAESSGRGETAAQQSGQWSSAQQSGSMVQSSLEQARIPRRAWESGISMANSTEPRRPGAREHDGGSSLVSARSAKYGIVGDSDSARSQGRGIGWNGSGELVAGTGSLADEDAWREVEWLPCRDGKSRPVEPGTFPLAHGIPGRVGRLRGYGNAIVPQVAAAFVEACMDVL